MFYFFSAKRTLSCTVRPPVQPHVDLGFPPPGGALEMVAQGFPRRLAGRVGDRNVDLFHVGRRDRHRDLKESRAGYNVGRLASDTGRSPFSVESVPRSLRGARSPPRLGNGRMGPSGRSQAIATLRPSGSGQWAQARPSLRPAVKHDGGRGLLAQDDPQTLGHQLAAGGTGRAGLLQRGDLVGRLGQPGREAEGATPRRRTRPAGTPGRPLPRAPGR